MALSAEELVYQEAVDYVGEIELNESSNHNTKPYSTCVRHYEQAKNEMLRGYDWNEASDLALCLQDATRPPHTYIFRFPLPTDCLRPVHTTKPRDEWRVLSGYIYTNYKLVPDTYTVGTEYFAGRYIAKDDVTYLINTGFTATLWATDVSNLTSKVYDYGFIEISYIKTLDDPGDWSVDLRHAIILNLASKIVVPINGDKEARKELLEELYKLVLPHAHAIDAIQGKPLQMFYSETTDARGEA